MSTGILEIDDLETRQDIADAATRQQEEDGQLSAESRQYLLKCTVFKLADRT
jgi:hypothetical protein